MTNSEVQAFRIAVNVLVQSLSFMNYDFILIMVNRENMLKTFIFKAFEKSYDYVQKHIILKYFYSTLHKPSSIAFSYTHI
jgi:hypothetical protein